MWARSSFGLRLRKKAASWSAESWPCARRFRESSGFCGVSGSGCGSGTVRHEANIVTTRIMATATAASLCDVYDL